MPLSLNNNRGSVYSGRMKIEVPEGSVLRLVGLTIQTGFHNVS